jgi:hypothetical protein
MAIGLGCLFLAGMTACQRSSQATPTATAEDHAASKVSLRSVDPYHALIEAGPGAFSTSHVFVMDGDMAAPSSEKGEFQEVEEDGSLRFVIDLLPGGTITLWSAPSGEAADAQLSGRIVLTAHNQLPMIEEGGTDGSGPPVVDPEKIRLVSLDSYHALLEGSTGAAEGRSLAMSYGRREAPIAGEILEHALNKDGSFQVVVDTAPGGEVTLWSISGEEASAPLPLRAELESAPASTGN